MKFTRLENDLSHVSKLPDIPTLENGYSPKTLKEIFDRASEQIKEYLNSVLLSELEDMGASRIGTGEIETLSGKSIQEKLETLARQVSDISNASIPDGTISPEKFIPSVASFMTNGSPRYAYYRVAGEYTFVPTRTGNYKITVQGGGAGGGVGGTYLSPYGGGSGATAIGWVHLEKGCEYTVKAGLGGKGLRLTAEGRLMADAESGEASGFYSGDTELLFADGGLCVRDTGGPAVARGGVINIKGRSPSFLKYESGICYYTNGAESYFSSPTEFGNDTAGAGAGGYGASRPYDGLYTNSGGDGGDGAVLIEWME